MSLFVNLSLYFLCGRWNEIVRLKFPSCDIGRWIIRYIYKMVRIAKNRRHIKRENRSSPDWIADAREHEAANSVGATICESDSTYGGQSQLKWWVVRSMKDVVNYEYLNCCRIFCDPDFVPINKIHVVITTRAWFRRSICQQASPIEIFFYIYEHEEWKNWLDRRLVNKRTFIFNYFDEILSFEINIAPLFFNVSIDFDFRRHEPNTEHAHCQSSYNVLISIKVHLYAETYAYSKRTLHSIFSRQTRKRTVHRTRIPSYSTSIFALPFPLLIARLTSIQ